MRTGPELQVYNDDETFTFGIKNTFLDIQLREGDASAKQRASSAPKRLASSSSCEQSTPCTSDASTPSSPRHHAQVGAVLTSSEDALSAAEGSSTPSRGLQLAMVHNPSQPELEDPDSIDFSSQSVALDDIAGASTAFQADVLQKKGKKLSVRSTQTDQPRRGAPSRPA